jgi:Fur family ferric uptake transcriptional regulator
LRKLPLNAGRRQTEQRRLVWQAISALGPHCTAEEIAERIQADRPGFPRSTVYRALEAFTMSGALRPVRFGSGPTHYEISGEDHQHAICQVCEGILHLEDSLVDELEGHLEQRHRFTPVRTEVLVIGVCDECARSGAARPVRRRNLEHVHYSAR